MPSMRFFIVDLRRPWREIQEAELPVVMCKRTVWAVHSTGQRSLLGSSAFFTMAAAGRCRTALLTKLKTYKVWRAAPRAYYGAASALQRMH